MDQEILIGQIESLLFVLTKPLALKQLAKLIGVTEAEVRIAVESLAGSRNSSTSGIHLLISDDLVQLVTNPEHADLVAKATNVELDTELTRPSLETLTIVAYRGPLTKPEIEAIRGVNCSLILRNLQLRGLVDERDDVVKMQPTYRLSTDALRFFGVHEVSELPDYATLHVNAKIDALLSSLAVGSL
ncbi:TPA: SMC-Scp complex subunit ScpB [Candidatus Uhrbacteria bacterium]|nr:SMC-Scp complex subunit ScpB [Candidatus Uhrbacteria bacterium]